MSSKDLMSRIKAASAVNAGVAAALKENGIEDASQAKVGTDNQETEIKSGEGQQGNDPNVQAEPIAPPNPNQTQPLNVQQRAADPAQDALMNGTVVAANQGIDGQPVTDMNPPDDLGAALLALAPERTAHSIVAAPEDNGQATGMAGSYQPAFVRAGYGQTEYFNPSEDDLKTIKKGEFLAGTMKRWIAPNGEIIKPVDGVFLPIDGDGWDEAFMIRDLRHIAKRNDGSLFEGTGS